MEAVVDKSQPRVPYTPGKTAVPSAQPQLSYRKGYRMGKKGYAKDPETGTGGGGPRGGRGAATTVASTAWKISVTAVLVATTIISVTALIGMALTAHHLVENVRRIDKRIGADRVVIEGIENDIDTVEGDVTVLNETMPEGNGTVFFDDEWVMVSADDHSHQFAFNASLITTIFPSTRRNYALPDEDGTIALLENLPATQTEFADDAFAIYEAGSPLTRLEFDLSLIDSGVTRILSAPNKDGTIATLDDITTMASSNQTTFFDSQFTIENDPDTSKTAMFDASQIMGDRTFTFPNLDGTLVLTEGAQTITDKTLVANSTLLSGPTGDLQFDVDALTTTRTYTFTDRNLVVLGRAGVDWGFEAMGWSTSPGTYSYVRVASAFQRDRFFEFSALGSGSGGDVGRAGIAFSWFNQHTWRMSTGVGGGFALTYSRDGIPTTNNDLGDPVLLIQPLSGVVNFVDLNDPAKRARFDISTLTGIRTFDFPDQSGTLALESNNLQVTTGTWTLEVDTAQTGGLPGPFTVTQSELTRIGNTVTARFEIRTDNQDDTSWVLYINNPTNSTVPPNTVVGWALGNEGVFDLTFHPTAILTASGTSPTDTVGMAWTGMSGSNSNIIIIGEFTYTA